MAANLTPQYLEAEAEYKKAQTAAERLECLKKMYSLLPKHKASEKLQADLKTKIKDTREDAEKEKKQGKKSGVSYRIPKQGAGQYVLLGGPNVGKSRLVTRLTRAASEVAPYPFSTHEPVVGMMDWHDARVQLIDLPPVTADFLEPYITSLTRSASAAVLMVDLGDDDGPFAAQAVIDRLAGHKAILTSQSPADELDPGTVHVPTVVVANKCDLPGMEDRLAVVREFYGAKYPVHVISAEHGTGLEDLRDVLYRILNVIRVYSKEPGKPADKTAPFTCPAGSTLVEFAALVHRDFSEKLKTARVWGTGVFDGQPVKRDHILHDGDVVELHI